MRHLVTKIVLIVAILALCLWYIYPPKERLRLGKDLRGGVSMVYRVTVPEGADRQQTIRQVIEVLKDRVNPTGVLDIAIQPQGADRIEVVMPLPSPEVRALQTAFRDQLDQLLRDAQISGAELEEALRSGTAATRFGSTGELAAKAKAIQEAYDGAKRMRAELAAMDPATADPAAVRALEAKIADTEISEERLRGELLAMSIDQPRLIRALGLSNVPTRAVDSAGKEVVDESGKPKMDPSPRAQELAAIKAQFPYLADRIDLLVAANDAYTAKRTTLDDPEDLRRLLRGAGVLEFHIAVRGSQAEGVNVEQLRKQLAESGPGASESATTGWFKINDLKQWYNSPAQRVMLENDPVAYFSGRNLVAAKYDGDIFLLLYTAPSKSMTHIEGETWTMERVGRTVDSMGRPAVSFSLDQGGGSRMGRLTGPHVQQPMAIVLDGQVYSAPNLNSQINGSGIIEGQFSDAELSYLVRVLAAGALEARLSPEPISTSILGPSIGGDNLRRGLQACLISVIVVGIYMLLYYFVAGIIANISIACMGIIVFGVMAMMDSTFTLPGLAGVALTVAMTVDCNVLIYERIREELINNGEDLRTAVRIAFKRAFNTIVDGQISLLIVCVVLVKVATAEVKGFGTTMIIGVLATLFVSLVITRVIFVIYTDVFKFKKLPMLATVFPETHKLLEPHVDWMSRRKVFFTFSTIVCVSGMLLVWWSGKELLDTEFRGGVALTMSTRAARPGEAADPVSGRLLESRAELERQVHEIGENNAANPALGELASATVLTVGETTEDFRGTTFQIKVANPKTIGDEEDVAAQIQNAVVEKFRGIVDAIPELAFAGMNDRDHAKHTFALTHDRLGDSIDRPKYTDPVGTFAGGVAIVIDEINPPVTDEAALHRIQRTRGQPAFAATAARSTRVVGLELADPGDPSRGYKSLAVLVRDPELDARKVDINVWDERLAGPEWKLVSQAMRQASSLDQVSSFSSAVARTLSAQALVAIALSVIGIVAYVWFRFNSLRYSIAAMTATAHDVIVALAGIALAHYIAPTAIGRALLLEPFRIDLNVVAAILTLIGYSLNDTIVIMDRIRENRGKLPLASSIVINNSINQTMSRTFLTMSTTLLAILILYIQGGTGIRPFAFVLLVGLITGTYSSVAIAAPLVWTGDAPPEPADARRRAASGAAAAALPAAT